MELKIKRGLKFRLSFGERLKWARNINKLAVFVLLNFDSIFESNINLKVLNNTIMVKAWEPVKRVCM